ncbi:MAG: electron transport complex subunit RsxC [Clostridia bacterium]
MKKTFHGGVHPLHSTGEGKMFTRASAVTPLIPEQVIIPVSMHLGAPSAPCVEPGQHVQLGQVIAMSVGGLGLPVHASVSGEVLFVDERQQLSATPQMCIGIRNDKLDDWAPLMPLGDVENAPADKIIACVKNAGICGLGGASFPTHIKMSIPEGKTADTVILNGAECEPYLTADHRLMLETPERIVGGLRLILRATGVSRGVIAIESNKPDAIDSMTKAIAGVPGVEILMLKTKYPQGSEKQLIHTVTGRQVPRGKLPVDAHTLVFNVGTAAAVFDAVTEGKPLIQRITTVTGCVNQPANLLLRVGTTYDQIFAACGGLKADAHEIFAGGPMCGLCAPDDTVSMTKATNGIIVFSATQARDYEETSCIRCGRCVETCPIGLYPYELRNICDMHNLDKAKENGLSDCVLCGACSYICPARRYLTASFKAAREELAARGRK